MSEIGYFLLLLAMYLFGLIVGRVQGRLKGITETILVIQRSAVEVQNACKLAELQGIDTSKLTPEQIVELVQKRRGLSDNN